jgi:hypothetical protein
MQNPLFGYLALAFGTVTYGPYRGHLQPCYKDVAGQESGMPEWIMGGSPSQKPRALLTQD